MPDGEERSGNRDRRGLDPTVLAFLRELVESYDRAHRREHEIQDEATKARIELAAERVEELAAGTTQARKELHARITEHYDTILAERESRYTDRFESSQTALETAAVNNQKALEQALQTAKDETAKTEASWVKQADAQYVKVEQLQTAISKVVPREESETNKKEIDRRLSEMDRRMTVLEAAKAGKTEMLPWVIAAVAVAGLFYELRGR